VSRVRRLFCDLRDAVRGVPHDYTEGSLSRGILLLAVPMVLEMLMESIFAVVDVFFVSRLGAEAVAVVGLTETLMTLVIALGVGLSLGAAAVVARRIGEKRVDRARTAAGQALLLGLAISLPISVVGILFGREVLVLIGAEPEVVALGHLNAVIMLGGNITLVLLTIINGIFRGAGNPAIAMRVLWLANGINIVLDPLLIFGIGPFPEMGVVGAATATNIGRGIGVIYQLIVLFRGNGDIALTRAHLRLDSSLAARMLRVSIGTILQLVVAMTSWIVLVRMIAIFGSTAVAGYTIGVRIVLFAIQPAWGMACAAATLVGQNLGAEQPGRAERAVWLTCAYNMAFLVTVSVGFIVFDSALIGLFTRDPAVIEEGARCLRIVACSYLFYASGMVLIQSFNGSGDTRTPTLINLLCYWIVQLPLAYVLAVPFGLESTGVYVGIAVAQALSAMVSAWIFRKGRWQHARI